MHFVTIFATSLLFLGIFAAPHPISDFMLPGTCESYAPCSFSASDVVETTITTLSLTLTVTSTHTHIASATQPAVNSAYGLLSSRSGSSIHQLLFIARDFRLWLGGETAAYCPTQVDHCPPGDDTVFLGTCAMDVEVPGGQQLYVTPAGEIGYTQAHSATLPPGSNACPFVYNHPTGSEFGIVTLNPQIAFGATGFMACSTDSGYYQVFANVKNATVPQSDVTECLGFSALAPDYSGGLAAWQYI